MARPLADQHWEVPHYPDTGCAEGGPRCLECRLARCVLESGPPSPSQVVRDRREREAKRLIEAGIPIPQIARRLHRSVRSIQRYVEDKPRRRGLTRPNLLTSKEVTNDP